MTSQPDPLWQSPPQIPHLEDDKAHIWRVRVPAVAPHVDPRAGVISEEEWRRADRFYFDRDRRRFLAARWSLRIILGAYLGRPPGEIEFGYGPQGKPNLDPVSGSAGLQFNLTHSGEWVSIAASTSRHVGVDVEQVRQDFELEKIARRFFSPNEVQVLLALDEPLRPDAFFRCWTRKEAYIKARGGGLSIPLHQFDVTLAPDRPAVLLATRDDPLEAARWTLYGIDLCQGYQAALVVEGAPLQVQYWEFIARLS